MLITPHNPTTIFPPAGPYAHGVEVSGASRLLFISGTMGLAPDSTSEDGFEAQCARAWRNIGETLAAAGMHIENLVKVTCFIADAKHRNANAAERARVLGGHRVAVTVVVAGLLDSDWLLEIEAVAAG